MNHTSEFHNRRRVIFAISVAAGLSACATKAPPVVVVPVAPPPPVLPIPKPQLYAELLREKLPPLGFQETEEGWLLNLSAVLLFATNAYELKAESVGTVRRLSADLKAVGVKRLRIVGYTDNVGTDAYNSALSQRRANSVTEAFIGEGFSSDRVERLGLGPKFPIATNDTPEGRAQNRRVAVIVPIAE